MHAARDREAERGAFEADDLVQAMRRVRAAAMALSAIEAEAGRLWEDENCPVPLPLQLRGGLVHPQRAAALADFVADWSPDPHEPIAPTRSLKEITDELSAAGRAELADAERALTELEAERHAAVVE